MSGGNQTLYTYTQYKDYKKDRRLLGNQFFHLRQ